MPPVVVTLSRSKESIALDLLRCFAALSMTAWSRLLHPLGVTLSRSEGVWVTDIVTPSVSLHRNPREKLGLPQGAVSYTHLTLPTILRV